MRARTRPRKSLVGRRSLVPVYCLSLLLLGAMTVKDDVKAFLSATRGDVELNAELVRVVADYYVDVAMILDVKEVKLTQYRTNNATTGRRLFMSAQRSVTREASRKRCSRGGAVFHSVRARLRRSSAS